MADFKLLTDAEIDKMSDSELIANIQRYGNQLNKQLARLMEETQSAAAEYQMGVDFIKDAFGRASGRLGGQVDKFEFEPFKEDVSTTALRARLKILRDALASQKSSVQGLKAYHEKANANVKKWMEKYGVDISRFTSADWARIRELIRLYCPPFDSDEIIDTYTEERWEKQDFSDILDFMDSMQEGQILALEWEKQYGVRM